MNRTRLRSDLSETTTSNGSRRVARSHRHAASPISRPITRSRSACLPSISPVRWQNYPTHRQDYLRSCARQVTIDLVSSEDEEDNEVNSILHHNDDEDDRVSSRDSNHLCTICQDYASNCCQLENCGHCFCRECILGWLREPHAAGKCPNCREKTGKVMLLQSDGSRKEVPLPCPARAAAPTLDMLHNILSPNLLPTIQQIFNFTSINPPRISAASTQD